MAIKDGDKLPALMQNPATNHFSVPIDGGSLGVSPNDKVGMHGSVAVQRSGVAQAAVITTAPTNSTPYGYSQPQATAVLTLLNEIRAALVEKGIIKGS